MIKVFVEGLNENLESIIVVKTNMDMPDSPILAFLHKNGEFINCESCTSYETDAYHDKNRREAVQVLKRFFKVKKEYDVTSIYSAKCYEVEI